MKQNDKPCMDVWKAETKDIDWRIDLQQLVRYRYKHNKRALANNAGAHVSTVYRWLRRETTPNQIHRDRLRTLAKGSF